MKQYTIKQAKIDDVHIILSFIKELAEYEKMSDQVVATEELLKEWIFEKKKAEVLLAMEGDTAVGIALYFYNFSTFLGRAGIYLEDLFVKEAYRGKGYGKALLKELAALQCRRAVVAWSGVALTGISQVLTSICRLVRCPWMTGHSIV